MDLPTSGSDDEWEVCIDDGFIYKRKKRRLDPLAAAQPAAAAAETEAAEERFRRGQRKKTLLRIRERYRRELDLWENVSNTCRAMQDRAEQLQRERERERRLSEEEGGGERGRTRSSRDPPDEEVPPEGEGDGVEALVDKLLLKAEAQEEVIQDASNLCDIVESLCKAREEEFKQSLIDLPVWAPPQDLMAALSDD